MGGRVTPEGRARVLPMEVRILRVGRDSYGCGQDSYGEDSYV